MTERTTIPIAKRHLSDEVARTIKELIFDLKFRRGERLIVESLAEQLGVSMTPIREGLKQLVNQGIVEYDGKSYAVLNPTNQQIQDMFDIRRYLEKLSANAAARYATDEQLQELYEFQFVWRKKQDIDLSQFIAFDIEFHTMLAKSTGNERLLSLASPVNEQCHLLRLWSYEHRFPKENLVITVDEHLAILDAMKARQPQKAEEAMDIHLLKGEAIAWRMFQR